jgi:hypothetical protein
MLFYQSAVILSFICKDFDLTEVSIPRPLTVQSVSPGKDWYPLIEIKTRGGGSTFKGCEFDLIKVSTATWTDDKRKSPDQDWDPNAIISSWLQRL